MTILEFYQGQSLRLKNNERLTLEEILNKDNNWWDECHDFIQWIFPTKTVSNYSANAPILDLNTAALLSQNYIDLYIRAIGRFLEFLDSQDMDTPNHNHLRITRMLESIYLIDNANKLSTKDIGKSIYLSDKATDIPQLIAENIKTYNHELAFIDNIVNHYLPLNSIDNGAMTSKFWNNATLSKW